MNRRAASKGILFLAVLALGLVGAGDPNAPVINPSGYTSSEVCRQCHEEIFQTWKNSMHANAFSDPIFQTAFVQAVTAEGDRGRQLCLGCHAPTAVAAGGRSALTDIDREGVTCDFCHTVKSVTPDGSGHSFVVEPGLTKRSTLKQASSPVHEVAYSPLHETSEFCAGCHEFQGKLGVLVLGTYSEWKAGPYAAEGVHCQNCHMPLGTGTVVRADLATSGPHPLNLHDISGAHSEEMFRKAVKLEVTKVVHDDEALRVSVSIVNAGAGHLVPTGMPTRKIKLEVRVLDRFGRGIANQERIYGRTLLDEAGQVLTTDYAVILYAAQVRSDNRLRPREPRLETFQFRVARQPGLTVEASLTYTYTPELIQPKELNVDFLTVSQPVE